MSDNIKYLIVGLFVVAILVACKIITEGTYYGRLFDGTGHRIWHSLLSVYDPQENLPVIVLDISDLKREKEITPVPRLMEMVTALVEDKAKAIAIDVDFSPRLDPKQDTFETFGRAEGDEEFFEFLRQQPVPVFVGVFNPGAEPETWLGLDENQTLAADITFYGSEATEIPAWFQCDGQQRLSSISKALADKFGDAPHPPSWMKNILINHEDPENLSLQTLQDVKGKNVLCRRSYFPVNYAKLRIVQKQSLQTLDRVSILNAKDANGHSRFQNKLVLIGNGQRTKATDQINVEGYNETIPGIYVHAMGTYTLAVSPVYNLRNGFSVILDSLLGLFIVVGLFVIRQLNSSIHIFEAIFILISIVLVFVLGFALVSIYGVIWSDFLLVVFALLLHSHIQSLIGSFFIRFKPVFPRSGKITKS